MWLDLINTVYDVFNVFFFAFISYHAAHVALCKRVTVKLPSAHALTLLFVFLSVNGLFKTLCSGLVYYVISEGWIAEKKELVIPDYRI